MTMVCVTHEMGFARDVADRISSWTKGILERATPEDFFNHPQHPRAQQFARRQSEGVAAQIARPAGRTASSMSRAMAWTRRWSGRLEGLSHQFFALDETTKMQWRMALGGRAWRGYFPLGGELTSGRPDWKEGLYLGTELPASHPAGAGEDAGARPQPVPGGAGLSRGHPRLYGRGDATWPPADGRHRAEPRPAPPYFAERYTADPLICSACSTTPRRPCPSDRRAMGRGRAHRLRPADHPVTRTTWAACRCTRRRLDRCPADAGSFVCNIGDMLDRMTGGLYRRRRTA
jgi:hypothetical protein